MTGAVLALLLAGCGSISEAGTLATSASQLSHDELAEAYSAADEKAESEDAHITSATVTAEEGTVPETNTGYRCSSGRLLRITLIGTFPHAVVAHGPANPSQGLSHSTPMSTPCS